MIVKGDRLPSPLIPCECVHLVPFLIALGGGSQKLAHEVLGYPQYKRKTCFLLPVSFFPVCLLYSHITTTLTQNTSLLTLLVPTPKQFSGTQAGCLKI